MPDSIVLSVTFFGAFREYDTGTPLSLFVPHGATLAQVRHALKAAMNNDPLIEDSALADDTHILPEETIFERDTQIALLPPVCGG
jgi:molybdopterin converting factor small subunit